MDYYQKYIEQSKNKPNTEYIKYIDIYFSNNDNYTREEKDSPVLQFGKQSENGKRFALDFRYPMAPVQAFGIFLTACNWCGPKQKD